MTHLPHRYSGIVQETWLDAFGHVNNARFMELYEQARWQWLADLGYTLQDIQTTGLGMVVLRAEINYQKELTARQPFEIQTQVTRYIRKTMLIQQIMTLANTGEKVSDALITGGLFSLSERKLLNPPPEWIERFGVDWHSA